MPLTSNLETSLAGNKDLEDIRPCLDLEVDRTRTWTLNTSYFETLTWTVYLTDIWSDCASILNKLFIYDFIENNTVFVIIFSFQNNEIPYTSVVGTNYAK